MFVLQHAVKSTLMQLGFLLVPSFLHFLELNGLVAHVILRIQVFSEQFLIRQTAIIYIVIQHNKLM